MAKTIKAGLALVSIALVSACAQQVEAPAEEVVIIDPAPISVEPVYTGKYK